MFLKILVLALLSTTYLTVGTDEVEKDPQKNCDQLNDAFIKGSHEFTKCVLKNNENATFCEECVEEYANVLKTFNDLITSNETEHKGHQPCRDRYVDANQLGLVETVLAHSKQLWTIGDCSDCYNKSCDLLNYSSESCPRSNHTQEFEKLLKATTDCFEKTDNTQNATCSNCTDQYVNLSNFYNSIRLKTSDKFCSSIKYQMNKTQQHWANELHCCEERKSSLEDFSLMSSLSITLSIAFYIFTFIMGKRKERVQDIPDDLMPPRDADQSDDTAMNINPDEPTTSELPQAILFSHSKILNNFNGSLSDDDDDNDDADEDILPIENTNLIEIGQ